MRSATSDVWRVSCGGFDAGSLSTLAGEVGRTHGESGRLRLFVSMPYRKAWALLETEPDTFREAYWEKVEFDAGTYPAQDVHEMVDGLLKADRPLVALKPASHNWDAVETSRLTKLLHALAGVTKRFDGSGIAGAFESLDRRFEVTVEEKAKLEFMFFRALRQSRYRVPNLARQMVSSPGLYAEAVIRAFSRRNRGDDPPELRIDDAEQRKDLAMVARDLLQWLHRIPGSDARDAIDGEKLTTWLAEVRALCVQYGRAEAGDLSVGTLLSHAPHDDDGRWAVPAGLRSPGADVVRRSRPGIHHRHSKCSRCRHAPSWRRRRPGTRAGSEVSRLGAADRVRVSACGQHPRAHRRWLRTRRRAARYRRRIFSVAF